MEQQPYVAFRMVDASGSQSELRLHIRRGTPTVTALAVAVGVAALLESITGASAVEVLARYPIKHYGPPSATAQQHAPKGVFVFTCSAPEQFCVITLPGIPPDLIRADNTLDESDGRVQALLSAMQTGFCNPFGYAITELGAAWRAG